jgi:hypothetical protein
MMMMGVVRLRGVIARGRIPAMFAGLLRRRIAAKILVGSWPCIAGASVILALQLLQ